MPKTTPREDIARVTGGGGSLEGPEPAKRANTISEGVAPKGGWRANKRPAVVRPNRRAKNLH